jgi:hypothetical protein
MGGDLRNGRASRTVDLGRSRYCGLIPAGASISPAISSRLPLSHGI